MNDGGFTTWNSLAQCEQNPKLRQTPTDANQAKHHTGKMARSCTQIVAAFLRRRSKFAADIDLFKNITNLSEWRRPFSSLRVKSNKTIFAKLVFHASLLKSANSYRKVLISWFFKGSLICAVSREHNHSVHFGDLV